MTTIETVCTLDFSVRGKPSALDTPEYLSVSENGRFIIIGNRGNLYRLDLHRPEDSWQSVTAGEDIQNAHANDDGSLWLAKTHSLHRIDHAGHMTHAFKVDSGPGLWGNTDWIVLAAGEAKRPKLNAYDAEFRRRGDLHADGNVIALWRTGAAQFRLLCAPAPKRLHLWQWDLALGKTTLLGVLPAASLPAEDLFNPWTTDRLALYAHILPGQAGDKQIQLVPFGVLVRPDGRMAHALEPNSWHPLDQRTAGHQDSETVKAALPATLAALSDGVDPTRPFFSTRPYLVTSVVRDDGVHVITTLWHKRVPLTNDAAPFHDKVEQALQDRDLAALLLLHCTGELPRSPNLARAIAHIVQDKTTRRQLRPLLSQRQTALRTFFAWEMAKAFDLDAPGGLEDSDPGIPDLRNRLKLAIRVPAAAEALEAVLRRSDPAVTHWRGRISIAALTLKPVHRNAINAPLRLLLGDGLAALNAETDPQTLAETLHYAKHLRLPADFLGRSVAQGVDLLLSPKTTETPFHPSTLAEALVHFRAKTPAAVTSTEAIRGFQRMEAALYSQPDTHRDLLEKNLRTGLIQLPSSARGNAPSDALVRRLLDRETDDLALMTVVVARGLVHAPDRRASELVACLHLRCAVDLLHTAVPCMASLNGIVTKTQLMQDTQAWLESLDLSAGSTAVATSAVPLHSPADAAHLLWETYSDAPPLFRWGLAAALWTAAARVHLQLGTPPSARGAGSLRDSPEAAFLAGDSSHRKHQAEAMTAALLAGMEGRPPMPVITRAVLRRARVPVNAGAPAPWTDADEAQLRRLADGTSAPAPCSDPGDKSHA